MELLEWFRQKPGATMEPRGSAKARFLGVLTRRRRSPPREADPEDQAVSQQQLKRPRLGEAESSVEVDPPKVPVYLREARNPQFAVHPPMVVRLAELAAANGMTRELIFGRLLGLDVDGIPLAKGKFAFHKSMADSHGFAQYKNDRSSSLSERKRSRRGFTDSVLLSSNPSHFMSDLWHGLDATVRGGLGISGHLRTIHFMQQQYLAAHYPWHNDHTEASNLTVVCLLCAEGPEAPRDDRGFLEIYKTGITTLRNDQGQAHPTAWFEANFDALVFPSLCIHATDIPRDLPVTSRMLKAALFYEIDQATFDRLFPGQPFAPPLSRH